MQRITHHFALAAALAGLVSPVMAADKLGSSIRGKTVAVQRCAACHGLDGNSTNDPATPKLAGQLREFLALQLSNYKNGERPHPVMAPLAAGLNSAQIADVSAWYASRRGMRSDEPPPVLASAGEVVFRQGRPGTPACQWCHGAQGQGVAPVFARLAGQNAAFVVAALQPYRKVDDFKNPYAFVMKAAIVNLSDADVDAVAAYVQTLK